MNRPKHQPNPHSEPSPMTPDPQCHGFNASLSHSFAASSNAQAGPPKNKLARLCLLIWDGDFHYDLQL